MSPTKCRRFTVSEMIPVLGVINAVKAYRAVRC
jgi:hypothetical protein